MADLAALDALLDWMRSQEPPVPHARLGDAELWLPDLPIAPAAASWQPDTSPDESPEDARRRDLETLLHSSGADVTPFLRGARAL